MFGRFIHKIKISVLTSNPLKQNPATVKKKENLKELFFFTEKKDKDEFNTILKHLIKLVKNFKTHCYVFFSFLTFSNISHLATFFFFFVIHLYKWCWD